MNPIKEHDIASKKRIGTLDGKPVVELQTTGGLVIVCCNKSGVTEVCGSGPHRAVARFLAKKREPTMTISELSKSDAIDMPSILSVAPKYEALTNLLNSELAKLP